MDYFDLFVAKLTGFWNYFLGEMARPAWDNYYYWFIGISLFFFLLEILAPWRKKQDRFRKDFWLDTFYMFFNIIILSLIGYNAAADVFSIAFNDFLAWAFGIQNLVAVQINNLPVWIQLLLMLIIADFIGYWIHRLLHKIPFLWEFHKVHHSVREMGFAAHLRYHWMENVVYNTLRYIPMAMIGFGIDDFLIIHIFNLGWGHFNHANFTIPLGPFKYLMNNPEMHIWHHAKDIPEGMSGVNFGLTLSIWDYIFGTNYIPYDGRDIELGFENVEEFPENFTTQQINGIFRKHQ